MPGVFLLLVFCITDDELSKNSQIDLECQLYMMDNFLRIDRADRVKDLAARGLIQFANHNNHPCKFACSEYMYSIGGKRALAENTGSKL